MGYSLDSTESTLSIKKSNIHNLMNDMNWSNNYIDLQTALIEEYYIEDEQGYSWDEDDTHFYFCDRFIQDTTARWIDEFFISLSKYIVEEPLYMEFIGEDGERWRDYLFDGTVKHTSPKVIWNNPYTGEDEEY